MVTTSLKEILEWSTLHGVECVCVHVHVCVCVHSQACALWTHLQPGLHLGGPALYGSWPLTSAVTLFLQGGVQVVYGLSWPTSFSTLSGCWSGFRSWMVAGFGQPNIWILWQYSDLKNPITFWFICFWSGQAQITPITKSSCGYWYFSKIP